MKEIIFVTSNRGKVISANRDLAAYGIKVVQKNANLIEPRGYDVTKVARAKALLTCKLVKKPLLVMDAGFYIDVLNGFPGCYVNYILDTIGLEGLLKLVDGKPRNCELRNALAYWEPGLPEPVIFESRSRGSLAEKPIGKMTDYYWSPLCLIFIPEGETRILSEFTKKEFFNYWRQKPKEASCFKKFGDWFTRRARSRQNGD